MGPCSVSVTRPTGEAVAAEGWRRTRPVSLCRAARSVAWCSASIRSAPDGSGLLRLGASSIQTDPEGTRRIVWMTKRMIKPCDTTPSATRPRRPLWSWHQMPDLATPGGPPRLRAADHRIAGRVFTVWRGPDERCPRRSGRLPSPASHDRFGLVTAGGMPPRLANKGEQVSRRARRGSRMSIVRPGRRSPRPGGRSHPLRWASTVPGGESRLALAGSHYDGQEP